MVHNKTSPVKAVYNSTYYRYCLHTKTILNRIGTTYNNLVYMLNPLILLFYLQKYQTYLRICINLHTFQILTFVFSLALHMKIEHAAQTSLFSQQTWFLLKQSISQNTMTKIVNHTYTSVNNYIIVSMNTPDQPSF